MYEGEREREDKVVKIYRPREVIPVYLNGVLNVHTVNSRRGKVYWGKVKEWHEKLQVYKDYRVDAGSGMCVGPDCLKEHE